MVARAARAAALRININTDGHPLPTKKRWRTTSKERQSLRPSPPCILCPSLPPPSELAQAVLILSCCFSIRPDITVCSKSGHDYHKYHPLSPFRVLVSRRYSTISAEGAVLTTISHCEFRPLAYLQVYPFGPRFLLFIVS